MSPTQAAFGLSGGHPASSLSLTDGYRTPFIPSLTCTASRLLGMTNWGLGRCPEFTGLDHSLWILARTGRIRRKRPLQLACLSIFPGDPASVAKLQQDRDGVSENEVRVCHDFSFR